MGREKLIKKLKSRGRLLLILGIILMLLGALLSLAILVDGFHPVFFIFLFVLACGILMMYFGINNMKGINSNFVKKNPYILDLVDDLFQNTLYEDNLVIISNRAIAPKKNLLGVSDINDVVGIYESSNTTNGIKTSHVINLFLRNGKSVLINIYGRKNETKDNLMLVLSNYCKNAMIGYTSETLAYIKEQRMQYKNRNK